MNVRTNKRQKEQQRVEKRKQKEARRAERKVIKEDARTRGETSGGEMYGMPEQTPEEIAAAAEPVIPGRGPAFPKAPEKPEGAA